MADQLQLRGGTTSEHSTFTGALREVTVDTDKDVLVVHDNSTAGGHPLMAEDGSNSALALGSAGTPSLKFTGDTNTGVFSPAADTVGVSTGGSERIRIDSSGRVGVGTSSPDANSRLHVSASENTSDPFATDASIVIANTVNAGNNEAAVIKFNLGNTNTASIGAYYDSFSSGVNSSLRFYTQFQSGFNNPAERMRIDPQGRVGINTTIPGSTLEVNGDVGIERTTGGYTFRSAVGGGERAGIHSTASNELLFKVAAASEAVRIDDVGRLLVGTSTSRGDHGNNTSGADTRLLVEGTGFSTSSGAFIRNTNTSDDAHILFSKSRGGSTGSTTIVSSGDDLGTVAFEGADGAKFVGAAEIKAQVDGTPGTSDMPGRLVFSTTADGASSPTERMRITQNGEVRSYSGSNSYSQIINNGHSAGTSYLLIEGRHSATDTSGSTGTRSFSVTTNGNVTNTNNSYGAISDLKLKENIVDASSQWNDLKAIQVRNYNFKEGQTHTQIGVVAQEVELVSPGLVTESPDRDGEGNDLGTTTKSVNYSVLYMKAVKALQEAMERIETLEAKVAALEAS